MAAAATAVAAAAVTAEEAAVATVAVVEADTVAVAAAGSAAVMEVAADTGQGPDSEAEATDLTTTAFPLPAAEEEATQVEEEVIPAEGAGAATPLSLEAGATRAEAAVTPTEEAEDIQAAGSGE